MKNIDISRAALVVLALIAGALLLTIGQMQGLAAAGGALHRDRLNQWGATSPDRAAALKVFNECNARGPEMTTKDCIARAATGAVAVELNDIMNGLDRIRVEAPAPLHWFIN
ncbi:hypothetical protein [Roseateles asaccharophilus]|uniref:hypothetical protein n=1 Tax=Roseateles asaccharophilus TaxID=582607 RepID=UPI0038515DDF